VTDMLYEAVSRIAAHEAGSRAVAAVGRVTDTFPAGGGPPDHAVSVELRDSGLTLPRVPIAVGVLGFAAIPAVGDLVLVAFAQGDLNAPYVVGRLYHPDEEPPEHGEGEVVLRLPSRPSAKKVELVVKGDEPSVELILPGDVTVRVQEEKVSLAVGAIEVALDGGGGGTLVVKAGGAALQLKQDGDISLKTTGKLSLEATEVSVKGSGKVSVKGAVLELN
jgi:Type VI secretion system/phage-baseplate injector OB domain